MARSLSRIVQKIDTDKFEGKDRGTHIDQDVGLIEHSSDTLMLGSLLLQGWCRKHVAKSKNMKLEIFPSVYLVLNRISGVLKVFKN